MAIITDNIGNYYLGDCIWDDSTGILTAYPGNDLMNGLQSLCVAAGLKFRNILAQAAFNTSMYNSTWLAWGANSDTIDDRWIFGAGNTGNTTTEHISFYNNSGYTPTNNTFSATNRLYRVANAGVLTWSASNNSFPYAFDFTGSASFSPVQWYAVSDGESLAIVAFQKRLDVQPGTPLLNHRAIAMWYAGTLNSPYTSNNLNRQVSLIKNNTQFSHYGYRSTNEGTYGLHYTTVANEVGKTGKASYQISGVDPNLKSGQNVTDFWVYDRNNGTRLGKVRNVLIGEGYYELGRPLRITGTQQPGGFNTYMPIGYFTSSRCLLLSCRASNI